MKTNDTIQKAVKRGISIGMTATLIIFGVVYILMISDDILSVARLEKALNTTGSYFGGIATLTAAYIASKMFNDWKVQHNIMVVADEAKKALIIINKDIELMSKITGTLRRKNSNENIDERLAIKILDYQKDISENLHISSNTCMVLHELTGDDSLKNKSISYHKYTMNVMEKLTNQLSNKQDIGAILKTFDHSMIDFLRLNKEYKKLLVELVLA